MLFGGTHLLAYASNSKFHVGLCSNKFITFYKNNYKDINVNFYVMDENYHVYNKDMIYNDYVVQAGLEKFIDYVDKNKTETISSYDKCKLRITFEKKLVEAKYKLTF